MKEDVTVSDGQFLLRDNEPFFDQVKDLDGEYDAEWYDDAFGTGIYIGVDYRFNPQKLLELFEYFEAKYSTVEKYSWSDDTYHNYDHVNNGGVYCIDPDGFRNESFKDALNEDGTLTSNITVNVTGGKYEGWTSKQGVFEVFLFKYNENTCSTCNYARFTTKEKLKEFFVALKDCIVSIDEDSIKKSVDYCMKEIKDLNDTIRKIQHILSISVKENV